jgi:hypothetical protein
MSVKILNTDSIKYLENKKDHSLPTIITGIPDMDEVNKGVDEYIEWFENVCDIIFRKVKKTEYCIFIQTDRKVNGKWIDKSYHIQKIAEKNRIPLLWHKIILYRPVNSIHLQRPTYGHMLCFSYECGPGKQFADVIEGNEKLYKNGTSIQPLNNVMNFCNEKGVKVIIDPFAGYGTISVMAKKYNISSLAIDIDKLCVVEIKKNTNK